MTCARSPFRSIIPLALILALPACGGGKQEAAVEAPKGEPGVIALTSEQIAKLGIATEVAQGAQILPLGTVPGTVSLPPEARVAVTTPFSGTVLRVLVIAGQAVRKGEALAVVRAAETVQFGGALARARAQLPVDTAQAARMSQLAREGIIAPARADEARATLAATRATIAENNRLLGMTGAAGDGTITLRSPIDGRVASVSVDTGAAVGQAGAPFVVENPAQLRLDLQIPERLAGVVRPGMAVVVEQDGASAKGAILSVAPSLDPMTRSLAAKASLAPGSALVPGKGVMVAIAGSGAAGGVSVPAAAVARVDGADLVFVRVAKGFARVKVNVSGQIGGRAFIAGGLKPGDRVAASGVAELKSLSTGG